MRCRSIPLVAVVAVAATATTACSSEIPAARPAATASPAPGASPNGAAPTGAARSSGDASEAADDPALLAPQVVTSARRAGIRPQLLMAILYNESYKPHDPQFQREWLQMDPDASLGVANMHRAAYDDTKRGRDFARRPWEDLIDDRPLGVEAAAWYLHDLSARLPRHWKATLTRDELLALGYNAGPGNMLTFARGVLPGPQAQAYLDKLHGNWTAAADALAGRAGTTSP